MHDNRSFTPGKKNAYDNLPKKVVRYNLLKSPFYAFQGLTFVFRREPNLTIQFLLGITLAIIAGYNGRWITAMANVILMSLVISLEIVNSVIETLCDVVEPNFNVTIKHIKDMAAASVLVVAMAWLVIIVYQIVVIFIFKNQNFSLQ